LITDLVTANSTSGLVKEHTDSITLSFEQNSSVEVNVCLCFQIISGFCLYICIAQRVCV